MNPGASVRARASTRRSAGDGVRRPTASMRSPTSRTSAIRAAAPVPSRTLALRISVRRDRSCPLADTMSENATTATRHVKTWRTGTVRTAAVITCGGIYDDKILTADRGDRALAARDTVCGSRRRGRRLDAVGRARSQLHVGREGARVELASRWTEEALKPRARRGPLVDPV